MHKKPNQEDLIEFKKKVVLINKKIAILKYELVTVVVKYKEESGISYRDIDNELHRLRSPSYRQCIYIHKVCNLLNNNGMNDAEILDQILFETIGRIRAKNLELLYEEFESSLVTNIIRQLGLKKGMMQLNRIYKDRTKIEKSKGGSDEDRIYQ